MKPEELAEKVQLTLPESSLCRSTIQHRKDSCNRIHKYTIEALGPRAGDTISFTDNEIEQIDNQEFLVAKLREKQLEAVETLIRTMELATKTLRRWVSSNRPKTQPECLRCSAFGRYEPDKCGEHYPCLCPLTAWLYPMTMVVPGPWPPRRD